MSILASLLLAGLLGWFIGQRGANGWRLECLQQRERANAAEEDAKEMRRIYHEDLNARQGKLRQAWENGVALGMSVKRRKRDTSADLAIVAEALQAARASVVGVKTWDGEE